MSRVLSSYVNYSLGGMTSVYRARALNSPRTQFDHVFEVDRGGVGALDYLPNATARLAPNSRATSFLRYLLGQFDYSQIRITSSPDIANKISAVSTVEVIYEIHSPNPKMISKELSLLESGKIDELWVPSQWSADLVTSLSPRRKHVPVRVVPNLVDRDSFNAAPEAPVSPLRRDGIPISWIGRLDNTQKNYLDFLRTLRGLPDSYYGLVIYSYENSPDRLERFLGDAGLLGVEDRLRIYSDVPQQEVASIHRAVRDAGGLFYSTALSESFGYAVLEAALCECRVVSFDVGPLPEHPVDGVAFVPVGDVVQATRRILELAPRKV